MQRWPVYDAVADNLKLSPAKRDDLRESILAALLSFYGAEIRTTMTALGAPDVPDLTVTDPAVVAALSAWADDQAVSIIQTYNAMLSRQIGLLPDGLTEAAAITRLTPFLTAVFAYNRETLVPHTAAVARQRAVEDFYANNGLDDQTLWEIQPSDTDQTDICLDAIEAGQMTRDEADQYWGVFPAHQRCPHALVPAGSNALSLPDDLWTGSDAVTSEAEAA